MKGGIQDTYNKQPLGRWFSPSLSLAVAQDIKPVLGMRVTADAGFKKGLWLLMYLPKTPVGLSLELPPLS